MDFIEGVGVLEMESYPLLGFRDFPESPGVYFVFDAKGAVWYVGETSNLRARFFPKKHHHFDDFLSFVSHARIACAVEESFSRRESMEVQYVKRLSPSFNVLHRVKGSRSLLENMLNGYAEGSKRCRLSVTEQGLIPFEDYPLWVSQVEPFFDPLWVRQVLVDEFQDIYHMDASCPRSDGWKRLTPEGLGTVIRDYLWKAYRQPQYEVPRLPRKPTP
jgi:predicted GIY-YIG superfamily endonuclease